MGGTDNLSGLCLTGQYLNTYHTLGQVLSLSRVCFDADSWVPEPVKYSTLIPKGLFLGTDLTNME